MSRLIKQIIIVAGFPLRLALLVFIYGLSATILVVAVAFGGSDSWVNTEEDKKREIDFLMGRRSLFK